MFYFQGLGVLYLAQRDVYNAWLPAGSINNLLTLSPSMSIFLTKESKYLFHAKMLKQI